MVCPVMELVLYHSGVLEPGMFLLATQGHRPFTRPLNLFHTETPYSSVVSGEEMTLTGKNKSPQLQPNNLFNMY
jgi:hypothetical protein